MSSDKPKTEQQAKLALDGRATIPPAIDRVIAMFRAELSGVRFPDVCLEDLEEAASAVRDKASELEALRQRVGLAELEVREQQRSMCALAERAIAYAKVYAADRPELATALDGIRLTDAGPRKARKARKPTKRSADAPDRDPSEGVHLVAIR